MVSPGAIAIPVCLTGRDMARRLRTTVSSLRLASAAESAVLALGGASAGRASFFNRDARVHVATVAELIGERIKPVPTRRARV